MDLRPLGRTGFHPSVIGFGAFKIGRNQGVKYPSGYDLPSDDELARLLDGVLACGINFFDTAPAYGLSEERLGTYLAGRRSKVILCTKVGEEFVDGQSSYDFSSAAIRRSVQRSLNRLRTDAIDLLLLHSNGDDLRILTQTDAVETLIDLRDAGLTQAIGFSGKTVDGAEEAMAWSDALMVEYNAHDESHAGILDAAASAGVGILVKKGLASGHLKPAEAIPFVLKHPAVTSLVIGGLNLEHLQGNVTLARHVESGG